MKNKIDFKKTTPESYDGMKAKYLSIDEAVFCPAKELSDIYKQTREAMFNTCGLPITTATNYVEK